MLKKYFFSFIVLSMVISCTKSAPKNYAILSGKIKNAQTNKITIKSRNKDFKKIIINNDGTFVDTLYLKKQGQLIVFSVKESCQVFLKNNDDVFLKVDANKFKETLNFTGKGSETSNYLAKKLLLQSKLAIGELFNLEKDTFSARVKEISKNFNGLLDKYKNIDSTFYLKEKKAIEALPKVLTKQYNQIQTQKK